MRDYAREPRVQGRSAPSRVALLLPLPAASLQGHFLRHRNFEGWVDRNDGSPLFAQVRFCRPFSRSPGVTPSFEACARGYGH